MRDKPDKELDLIDPIESFDPGIKKKVERLQEVVDQCIIFAALIKWDN